LTTTSVVEEHAAPPLIPTGAQEQTMKLNTLVWSLAGALLFVVGVATGQLAQPSTDSPQRVEQKRTDLTGAPGMEVHCFCG
jgi:hypothetical protein